MEKIINQDIGHKVFLVHGTFAENAEWIQKGSKISTVLDRELNGKVIPFSWNGRNSHKARSEAALNLRNAIQREFLLAPNSTFSIVAHSHGGNVAIRAISGLAPEVSVKWLVCLGTPFLVCGPSYSKHLGNAVSWAIRAIIFVLMCIPLAYSGLGLAITWAVDDFGIWSFLAALIFFCLMLFLTFWLPNLIVCWIIEYISRKHQNLADDLSWPKETNAGMLNYQIAYDEARIIVSFFSKLSGLPRKAWDLGAEIISKFFWKVFMFALMVVAISELLDLPEDHWIIFSGIPAILLLFIHLLLIPLFFLALVSPLLRSHPAGFGWEGITQHFIYDVDVTKNPEQHWVGRLENANLKVDTRFGKLGHSLFYDEDDVINNIVAKLRS